MALRTLLCSLLVAAGVSTAALADPASFDLAGPGLRVSVTHAGQTLPVGQAPNLSPGDVVQVRPDFPKAQGAHYLLVLAFLRGATNPPPKSWFYRVETWTKAGEKGVRATVPAGAEQAVVFLAPATGGDFGTLVNAVRGRPGAFVRAAQALHQASLDRSRLDAFLSDVRRRVPDDPDRLKTVSPLLARSLTIKLNEDCLRKTPELQAACLTAGQDALVLDDGHAPSMMQNLTTGDSASLAMQITATPKGGFGYYSPYVAAVIDMAHILDGLHTAQYQYIPALPSAHADELSLLLNTPPSFHKPQSVLVTSLPPVQAAEAPALAAVDPKAAYCLEKPDLVLPVEGAPLIFSTGYARNLVLQVKDRKGVEIDLPARPDAEKGGFVIGTAGAAGLDLAPETEGRLVGQWGFESFAGPSFRLQSVGDGRWTLAAGQAETFSVGRTDTALLQGAAPACVESVTLKRDDDAPVALETKLAAGGISAALPLANAAPSDMTLLVTSFGGAPVQSIPIHALADAGRLDSLELHAGDSAAVLKGARLDEVKAVEIAGARFSPGALTETSGADSLTLVAAEGAALAKLTAGRAATAVVELDDGRKMHLRFKVAAPRPQVQLIGRSVQLAARPASRPAAAVELTGPDELPQDAQLVFSVRADGSTRFTPHAAIEVATADGAVSTTLAPGAGLMLEDPTIAVATLDAAKAFGGRAFGPLRFRLVDASGASDWRPLGSLVRTPGLARLRCTGDGGGCTLMGSDLFLIDQISASPTFERSVAVPAGFPGQSIAVPAPRDGRLYVKLHDDPTVINEVRLTRPAPAG